MCKLTLFFIGNKQICKFTQLYMDWCGLFVGKLCKFYTFFFIIIHKLGEYSYFEVFAPKFK